MKRSQLPDWTCIFIAPHEFPQFKNAQSKNGKLRVVQYTSVEELQASSAPFEYLSQKECYIFIHDSFVRYAQDIKKILADNGITKHKLYLLDSEDHVAIKNVIIDVPSDLKSLERLAKRLSSTESLNVTPVRKRHKKVKRLMDIVVSATMLLLLSPVMLLVALAVRLESKGNVFYTSKRAGQYYRIFDFYKFRSMYADADKRVEELKKNNQYGGEGVQFFKLKNDPRITKVGAFIRKTSLDELPQLFNVLKGDMSLVGNRPLPLYEAEQLTTDMAAKRFSAAAGITGLWQVSKRGDDDMDAMERIMLDNTYADNQGFRYDLKIMMKTIPAMIQKEMV
ncbi:sugar transferase [Limibacter armeniacum]|uniref:sugar transferase n=1 Tax=Limibacter armeniacum TaxID=466084 RepID=UPI002FE6981E